MTSKTTLAVKSFRIQRFCETGKIVLSHSKQTCTLADLLEEKTVCADICMFKVLPIESKGERF